ncbi:hypothetical protein JKA74_04655 [Marivirga sp. S37H4]|uniref:Lipoprotein n=1 Tax=Marivirga aurantiaca TaxID=2802615 RepID=A0A934WWN7_9BACT|nr:hypothetical protein [Marivirga aurantiaca]MBK6264317.1 hypothetical protein [Marivirga aurantiaca]
MKNKLLSLLLLCILYGCSSMPELNNIDLNQWKSDKNGCNSYRISVANEIINQKKKLKGLSQTEIISLLGQADQHELYERSQKFFIYYLEPGKKCENYSDQYFRALYIRFNALDQAIDFNIQKIK